MFCPVFLHIWRGVARSTLGQSFTTVNYLTSRSCMGGSSLSFLQSANITESAGSEGYSAESRDCIRHSRQGPGLRKKCKFAILAKAAKERHVILRQRVLQLEPDSVGGQERSCPDITEARGGAVTRALPPPLPPLPTSQCEPR